MVGGSRVTLPCVRRWFGMREPGSSYLALPLPPGSSSGVAFGGNGAEFDNSPREGVAIEMQGVAIEMQSWLAWSASR